MLTVGIEEVLLRVFRRSVLFGIESGVSSRGSRTDDDRFVHVGGLVAGGDAGLWSLGVLFHLISAHITPT